MKIFCLLIVVFAHPALSTTWSMPTTNCSNEHADSGTHYGGCILKSAWGTAPTNFRNLPAVTSTSSSCVSNATKYIMVNGLFLGGNLSGQTQTDSTYLWIAKAVQEMLETDASSTCDGYNQCLIMQKMYEYRAAGAIVEPQVSLGFEGKWSLCDIIGTGKSSNQEHEVVEHLLHFITDVGFARAMPSIFGFDSSSKLMKAMNEAISAGMYVTTNYNSITPTETKERIKAQEYIYQLITTCWGFMTTYGNPSTSEWVVTPLTCDQVKVKNPLGYYLYENVIKKIIKMPSTATMAAITKMASGQTEEAAPTLSAGTTSNTVCTCSCSTGCCGGTPYGSAATYGTKPTDFTNANFTCKTASIVQLQLIALLGVLFYMF